MTNSRVQVIERALDILETLSGEPRSLSEICRETGLSKGTVFRLLAGLSHRSVVLKDPTAATYMLGPGLLRLAQGALSGVSAITVLGRPTLKALSELTGETVALHVRTGIERVCIDEIPSPQSIRYTSSVGSEAPLYVGSAGKVLLAFADEQELDRALTLMDRAFEIDRGRLEAELRQVAKDGYAISCGERVAGASAIGIPVHVGPVFFSLSVLGPTTRLPKKRLLEFLEPMREASASLDHLLGDVRPVAEEAW